MPHAGASGQPTTPRFKSPTGIEIEEPGDYPPASPAPHIAHVFTHIIELTGTPTHRCWGPNTSMKRNLPIIMPHHQRNHMSAPSIPPSAAPSRRATVRPCPPAAVQRYRESGRGTLGFEDAERERNEKFAELERRITDTLWTFVETEAPRDQAFRENEDERQRIFEDHEARREWEAADDETRLPPPPEPVAEPRLSAPESIRSVAQNAASRHTQEILDTVREEREEFIREWELTEAKRECQQAQMEAERARYNEDREDRIRSLEEELASVRAELENERQLRLVVECERREREHIEMVMKLRAPS
ncbi:uncharacterized protein B0H18DRAFT_1114913 [Fomitopsis serialis]|uniref:uncharacterized protein n=1 Tax=Fomitopsis serialis TaxID=139415 RepID=UPI0020073B6C|nr:uncharacterized protein B0H18DRAFT_1114913 [Neoantrodia serialis]KAH9934167.1 hypothetical protein B0H18DRAFT_1114913 [Neoantrodia serialis]